jgi:excisionase family DNA binding protein
MLTRRFLTVKEVAELIHVSEARVRHWIKLQQLRAIDLRREWRVIPRDLEAFLATHATCRAASLLADAGGEPTVVPASGQCNITGPAGWLVTGPVARRAVIHPMRPLAGRTAARRRKMLVRDLMLTGVLTFLPDLGLEAAARGMAERDVAGAPVVGDDGQLVGIITEGDLIKQLAASSAPKAGWFASLFRAPEPEAACFARVHGRTVKGAMTMGVASVN